MSSIYIPTLLFWENGNSWYGSQGSARFFIKPEKAEGEEPRLSVQFWRGPLAMDCSQILASAAFPVSEEGLAQTAEWLEAQSARLDRENSPE